MPIRNSIFNFPSQSGSSTTSTPMFGGSIQLALNDIKVKNIILKFALGCDNHSFKILTNNTWPEGFSFVKANINKPIVYFELSPINFKIINLRFSLGAQVSILTNNIYTASWAGYSQGTQYGEGSTALSNSLFYWGLTSSIAYDFNLSDISISPEISFYQGLNNELLNYNNLKSFRVYFFISFRKELNFGSPKESEDYYKIPE